MCGCLLEIPVQFHPYPLSLFTVMFGLPRSLVFLVHSTTLSSSMTSPTFAGPFPLVRKFEVVTHITNFCAFVHTQFSLPVKAVHADNGTKFVNNMLIMALSSSIMPSAPSLPPAALTYASSNCVLLGYPSSYKGYRCLDLTTRRIIISRHVVFDETQFPFSSDPTSALPSSLDFLVAGPAAPVLRNAATTLPASLHRRSMLSSRATELIWSSSLRIPPSYSLARS